MKNNFLSLHTTVLLQLSQELRIMQDLDSNISNFIV